MPRPKAPPPAEGAPRKSRTADRHKGPAPIAWRAPADLREALEGRAAEEGRPIAKLLEDAVRLYLTGPPREDRAERAVGAAPPRSARARR